MKVTSTTTAVLHTKVLRIYIYIYMYTCPRMYFFNKKKSWVGLVQEGEGLRQQRGSKLILPHGDSTHRRIGAAVDQLCASCVRLTNRREINAVSFGYYVTAFQSSGITVMATLLLLLLAVTDKSDTCCTGARFWKK